MKTLNKILFVIFIWGLVGSNYPMKADVPTVAPIFFGTSFKNGTMEEIWKDVRGYEGFYQISNLGNIKSLSRKIKHKKGYANLPEKLLKTTKTQIGYLAVNLSKNGKVKLHTIHRLVAETFLPNPDNKPEVNHKNGVKHESNIDNLEWATRSENQSHKYRVLGQEHSRPNLGRFGGDHNRPKAVLMYDKDLKFIREFAAISEASRYFGKDNSSAQISRACIGKSQTAYGYKWKYKI